MFTYCLWHMRGKKLAAAAVVECKCFDEDKPLDPLAFFAGASEADYTIQFTDQQTSIKYVKWVNGVAPNASPILQNGVSMFHGTKADLAVMLAATFSSPS